VNNYRLDGKIALITGAGSGLGRQFAKTLSGAGATVVLAARRKEKLEETASAVSEDGGSSYCVSLDVTSSSSIGKCFTEIISEVGTPDVLVNNAGIAIDNYLLDQTEDEWDAVLDTDLKGVFLVGQAAAKAMIEAGKPGSIINIASILGLAVAKTLASYGAAKAGVVSLTRTMALEWVRHNIRVNAIAPGYFMTEMNEHQLNSDAGEYLKNRIPMKRIGELVELGGPLLLLATDAGGYMTGSVVTVDGGQLCGIG
jgi:NAD(P)-dependent dehydrogenase (short-subunit alcohol dehydrogenase family)